MLSMSHLRRSARKPRKKTSMPMMNPRIARRTIPSRVAITVSERAREGVCSAPTIAEAPYQEGQSEERMANLVHWLPWETDDRFLSALSVSVQLTQTPCRFVERLIALAEGKADLLGAIAWITVKTGARHRRYTDFLHQVLGEGDVIGKTECADICHDIVGSSWPEAAKASLD